MGNTSSQTGAKLAINAVRNRVETLVVTWWVTKSSNSYKSLPPISQISKSVCELQALLIAAESTKNKLKLVAKIQKRTDALLNNIKTHHAEKTTRHVAITNLSTAANSQIPLFHNGFQRNLIMLSDVQNAFPGQHLCVKFMFSPKKYDKLQPVKDFESAEVLLPERYDIEDILGSGKSYCGIFCDVILPDARFRKAR